MHTWVHNTSKCSGEAGERISIKTNTGPLFYHIDSLRARGEWQIRQDDLDSGSLSRCQAKDSSLSSRELDRLMRADIK